MKIKIIPIFLIIFLSCSNREVKQNEVVEETAHDKEEKMLFSDIPFTTEETNYLESLKKTGYITASIRIRDTIYMPTDDGEIQGYNYKLAKSFTDNINIELKVKEVEFKDLFTKDGIIPDDVYTDPDYSYTPDLLGEVDLYIDNLTILPWRSKLLGFIETIPTRILLVSRIGEEVTNVEELDNKIIITLDSSSIHTKFKSIEKDNGLSFTYIDEGDFGSWFKKISDGIGDYTAIDANMTIFQLKSYNNLNVSFPISDPQILGWAVKKDNLLLQSILVKYLDFARETGLFNQLWMEDYPISLSDYINLLSLED